MAEEQKVGAVVMEVQIFRDVYFLFQQYCKNKCKETYIPLLEAKNIQGIRDEAFIFMGKKFSEFFENGVDVFFSFDTEDEATDFLNTVHTMHIGIEKLKETGVGQFT